MVFILFKSKCQIKLSWIVLTIAFLCLFTISFANAPSQGELDSLKSRLLDASSIEEKADIYLTLSDKVIHSNRQLALKYAEDLLELSHDLNNDSISNIATLNLARIYLLIGNYPRSLDLYQQVLKNKTADSAILLLAYNGVGIINYYQGDYKNAAIAYNKGLTFLPTIDFTKKNNRSAKQNILNNLGILYEEMKDYDKSEHYYNESLDFSKEINNQLAYASTLTNYGRLLHKQGKDSLALEYYIEALRIRTDLKDETGIILSYDGLGEYYFDLKRYDLAEKYLKQAISLASKAGDLLTVRRSSSHLFKIYELQNKYQLAFETLALNKKVSDSLFNDERTNKINQLKAEFEAERKLNVAKAKEREKELLYLLIGVGLLLSLIIVSLLFYLQRNKIRNSLLQQAHLKLEKESLEKDIELKNKELTANTMHLMQKNQLIDEISEKLTKIQMPMAEEPKQAIQKVVTDLQSNLRPELLKEFEFRFQQIHEDFYDILNERFPNLTPSERKLCAFLKLGMTSKEISAITHQNIKSLEIARTRLRKKLNLTNQDLNLVTYLSQLSRD